MSNSTTSTALRLLHSASLESWLTWSSTRLHRLTEHYGLQSLRSAPMPSGTTSSRTSASEVITKATCEASMPMARLSMKISAVRSALSLMCGRSASVTVVRRWRLRSFSSTTQLLASIAVTQPNGASCNSSRADTASPHDSVVGFNADAGLLAHASYQYLRRYHHGQHINT